MQGTLERIKLLFEQDPFSERSTSALIKSIYPKEYESIKSSLHDPVQGKEDLLLARRHKNQLHRRALYHLNKLVEEGFLVVSSVQGKGEKCYSLRHQEYHQSTARKPSLQVSTLQPLQRLETYQQKKIISVFDQQGWSQRLNAILLETNENDTSEILYTRIREVLPRVNDVIGLRNIQRLFINNDLHSMVSFLRKLDVETKDTLKRVNLHLDLSQIENESIAQNFISAYTMISTSHIKIIFGITPKYLAQHQRFFKSIIAQFIQVSRKINVQNFDVHKAPVLLGRAGVYTIEDNEWNTYLAEVQGKTIGLCYSHISMGIDVERFFGSKQSDSAFREFLLKVARTVVESSTVQRRRADDSFATINKLNDEPHEFFRFAVNYIRLWNYDWQEENKPHLRELLKTSSALIDEFCKTEETIFKSCGIPIRFKTTLSSAFKHFEEGFFSKRTYKKHTLTDSKALRSEEMQDFLSTRESLFPIFKETDRVRLFRSIPKDAHEIVLEFKHLLTNYTLPLITYDFAKRKETLTLDYFMN